MSLEQYFVVLFIFVGLCFAVLVDFNVLSMSVFGGMTTSVYYFA